MYKQQKIFWSSVIYLQYMYMYVRAQTKKLEIYEEKKR